MDLSSDTGKYVHQAETKLKSMSAAMRLKKPDEKMQDFRHYGSELEVSVVLFSSF